MTESTSLRFDTTDMAAVHKVFRSSLAAAPAFVGSAAGDAGRRTLIADYYSNVMAFLQVHHDGEEELVFPLLAERAPEERPSVDRALGQHRHVVALLGTATEAIATWAAKGDGKASEVVSSLGALDDELTPHLDQEEAVIVPLAAQYLTPEEWGRLPGHGLANFKGDKVWLILGLIRENMTSEQRTQMLEHMPPPARQMWETMGEASFNQMIAEVRQTA
jgi:Hemerythrin HHE cation binding domain